MKRIITIILMISILLIGTITSFAETKNIELNITGTSKVDITDKSVTIKIVLGEFKGIQNQISMGYEAALDYDTTVFESVTVKGLNSWNAEYEESSKKIIADVGKASANTEITEITFKLKTGAKTGNTKIKINNLLLTDSENDFTFNKELAITIQDSKTEQNNTNTNKTNNNTTANQNNTTTISKNATNTDKTTANTKIPAAGIRNIFIVIITVILVTGIISLIRYKTIKLK